MTDGAMKMKEIEEGQRRTNEAFVDALVNLCGYTRGHISIACTKMIAAMFISRHEPSPATPIMIDDVCEQVADRLRDEIVAGMKVAAIIGKDRSFACVGLEEIEEEPKAAE
jgi:hypothetical protein